jgi:acyl carrier protein
VSVPESGDRVPGSPHLEVSSTLEEAVAKLWADVLRCDRVGLDEHFLGLGGQSLQAVLLLLRVQEMFGVEVPFKTFLEVPTVRQLCVHICALRSTGQTSTSEAKQETAFEEGSI